MRTKEDTKCRTKHIAWNRGPFNVSFYRQECSEGKKPTSLNIWKINLESTTFWIWNTLNWFTYSDPVLPALLKELHGLLLKAGLYLAGRTIHFESEARIARTHGSEKRVVLLPGLRWLRGLGLPWRVLPSRDITMLPLDWKQRWPRGHCEVLMSMDPQPKKELVYRPDWWFWLSSGNGAAATQQGHRGPRLEPRGSLSAS